MRDLTPLGMKSTEPTGKRMLVVGADPSGLSAAYHLARRGHQVEVRDAGVEPGGMMRYGIPAHRLPRDVLAAEAGRTVDAVPFLREVAAGGHRTDPEAAARLAELAQQEVRQRWTTYEEMAARGPERFPAADGSASWT
jgi:NADPH-dependent 2,4-dienoyl-CoA reductase/sulfur reductase-like enzyme